MTLAALTGAAKRDSDHRTKMREMTELVNLFLLAAAWGFGACLVSPDSKLQLSELLILHATAQPAVAELLAEGYPVAKPGMCLHDYCVDLTSGVWQPWKDCLNEQVR